MYVMYLYYVGRMERKYDKASARIKELEAQAAVQATSSGGNASAESVAGVNLRFYAMESFVN